jgi:hypothetical protein
MELQNTGGLSRQFIAARDKLLAAASQGSDASSQSA